MPNRYVKNRNGLPATLVPVAALAVALLALWPGPASAQVFESVGTRALGMGGAFVAVADDVSATYWNPAGLATGASFDLMVGRTTNDSVPGRDVGGLADPRASGASATMVGLVIPAFGFSYYRLRGSSVGITDGPTAAGAGGRQDLRLQGVGVSSLVTHQVGVTLVQSLLPGLAVGGTFKFVRGIAATGLVPGGPTPDELLNTASDLVGRASNTVDVDAGVMGTLGPVRVGLVGRNLRAPEFEAPSGQFLGLQRQARLGVAVTPGREAAVHVSDPEGLIIAVDVDLTRTATAVGDRRMIAAGVERWFAGRRIGVRGGARGNTIGAARVVASGGASLAVKSGVFVEGELTRGHRDGDRGWGVTARVNF